MKSMTELNAIFPFRTALNTSTLFPYNLDILQQIELVAEAGYDGIELWIKDVKAYVDSGEKLSSLRRELDRLKLAPVNAIAFFKWCDQDLQTRKEGLRQAEEEMEMLAAIGCPAIAAPPFGDVSHLDAVAIAEYFSDLKAIGRKAGVEPYLEFWGRAEYLSTLEQAKQIVDLQPMNKMLIDPFHMYTGGSNHELLGSLAADQIGIVHVNDYPGEPSRLIINDEERLFPGEGIAPTKDIAATLHSIGYSGYLSLELFKKSYAGRSALETAKYGLNSIKTAYSVNAIHS
jgi:2-keto-myo-inositol isomerase